MNRKPLLVGHVIVRDVGNVIVLVPINGCLSKKFVAEIKTADIPYTATEYAGYKILWPENIA